MLLAAAGVAASFLVKSPAQVALDTDAPPPGVITARVEHRLLTDSVILRGTVTAGQSVLVNPTGAGNEGGRPVTTRMPIRMGGRVNAGQVVLEVSGRPVFVLKGSLPAYRDISPGTVGKDVKQLQQALSMLGHSYGSDGLGTFGAGTKRALNSFYDSIGYKPIPSNSESADQLEAAEDGVVAAERALEDAKDALGQNASTPDGDLHKNAGRAGEDLAKARRQLAKLRDSSGPMLPAAEVVYVREFPAQVTQVSTSVGAAVANTALTLSSGELVVHGYLQNYQKDLVRAGQKAHVLSESSGDDVEATVVSVGNTRLASGKGQDADSGNGDAGTPEQTGGYLMVVRPNQAIASSLTGQDVRVTVEAASTVAKALVVPVSAISSSADGKSVVTVVEDSGAQRRVVVKASTSGDGFIAVSPSAGETLREGDEVVVGADRGDTTGEDGK
ncbi:peptidoglycan-binding protein [Streptomyces sp. NBC_01077]|uniref:peptidoglycan-binding protein n=1 Tax=Streptomyces sp. NBC_01077 TaxID=2903746 RepID=UPI00386CD0F9|nr:peptidoglycan-binding protein [Streptomyces sp. NBC_01077]WSV43690.1 peptidoglycan-binding protein [Streptomyces sp. NBC_01077]